MTRDKQALKGPDAFQETVGKSWNVIEKNSSIVTGLLGILIVCALGYLVWDFMRMRSEKSAAEELYKTEAEYFKIKDGFDRAKFDTLAQGEKGKKDPAAENSKTAAASGELEKDYGKVVAGFENVVAKQTKTAAGTQAAIWLAEIYLDYKQPEKAVAALDKVTAHQSDSSMLFGIAHMMRGTALAAKGDCTQAVTSWQMVVGSKANSFLHPEALLKSGICYETLQQIDKATETYRKVAENHAETSAGQMAKTLLRALEMKLAAAQAAAKAG